MIHTLQVVDLAWIFISRQRPNRQNASITKIKKQEIVAAAGSNARKPFLG
jgi:hypothetical protein